MKPITIVGGGIAGLSLANALQLRNVPVTVYEKLSYPKHRVCGEFLSGVSSETLESLGVLPLLEGASSIEKVDWFIEAKQIISTSLPSQAWGLSRYTLDQRLAEQFTSHGGTLHTGTRKAYKPQEGHVCCRGKKRHGSSRQPEWLGLSIHLKDVEIDSLEMHSGAAGYIGICPVENDRHNLTGLFKRNPLIKSKGMELIRQYCLANKLHRLVARIENATPVDDSFAAIAGFSFGSLSEPSTLALGDAAHLIPPFVGNGMSMAFESAAIAAQHLLCYAKDELTWQTAVATIQRERDALFKKRMRVASHFHPLLLNSIGLKALSSAAALGLLPTKTLFSLTR